VPDWITHLCIAYLITKLFGIKKNRSLVFLGALLPDLFKFFIPFSVFIDLAPYETPVLNFFAPFHTVLGVLFSGLFTSSFFNGIKWRNAYSLILIGAFSHLFIDIFIYPWGSEMWSLWPIWQGDLGTGIFWSDSPVPAAISIFVCSVVIFLKKRQDPDVRINGALQ
jgi:membrane-bound metal-dependent hydrolase YbcI (DUF457 family)